MVGDFGVHLVKWLLACLIALANLENLQIQFFVSITSVICRDSAQTPFRKYWESSLDRSRREFRPIAAR